MRTHVVLAVHDYVVDASGGNVGKLVGTVAGYAQNFLALHQNSVAVALFTMAMRAKLTVELLTGLGIEGCEVRGNR